MSAEVGISGFAVYVPPYRVDLEQWCKWTEAPWDKTRAVVGRSFRMRGPNQSVYTMAATALMRLIKSYDIDPTRVGFLGLGTESSTDNSAGAVIVKGMLDEALTAQRFPPLSRHCEVPEVKHACLGGVYALKHALRYLKLEERDRCALVVSADIAEYARGSSGEPTQGAGAVAMWLERRPKLLGVRLQQIGSASAYRAVDFRKPLLANLMRAQLNGRYQDVPVFNGKYSTTCYLDETLHALSDMLHRLNRKPADYYRNLTAAFMHRPYHRMPETSFALSYLFGLADNGAAGLQELEAHCGRADLDVRDVVLEMRSSPDVLQLVRDGDVDADVYPLSVRLLKAFRSSEAFDRLITPKLSLGSEIMKDIGNVYCAALPAWIAAGIEEAHETGVELAGGEVLAVGYGSGDAAEAIPMIVMEDWNEAAARIRFGASLEPYQNLTREQYESLHDTGNAADLMEANEDFVIESVGCNSHPPIHDQGIEYYRFNAERGRTRSSESAAPE